MVKATQKAKGNRLKRSTVLTLPYQKDKPMRVWFPADYGDRIGANAKIKIEQFKDSGDVARTWTPAAGASLQASPSPYKGNAKVYWADVSTPDPPVALRSRGKNRPTKRLASGDLILVTVTITVPATATEPETSDVFEIEAVAIDLP